MIRTALTALLVALAITVTTATTTIAAENLVQQAGIPGGLIVHLGCADANATADLHANERCLVVGLDTSLSNVQAARKSFQKKGLSGKVTAETFNGKQLPLANDLVNLFVAKELGDLPMEEVMRVLVPNGTALIGGKKTVKPWPAEIGEWSHFLCGPDNNAVAKDSKVGLPRVMQWQGEGNWNRSHEEFSSISAVVTANGKLFYIADQAPLAYISFDARWVLVARDAFNGLLLWERPISAWNDHIREFRSGPAHLPRRLTAAGDKVYVTLGLDAPLAELDANTGKTLQTYKDTKWAEEVVVDKGILYVLVGSSEMNRHGTGLYTNEPKGRDERFLAAFDAKSGKELWRKNAKGKDFVLPIGVAVCEDKLYVHSIQGLGCFEAKTGKQLWFVNRLTAGGRYGYATSTLVATPDVVLLADRTGSKSKDELQAKSDIDWGVGGWNQSNSGPRSAQVSVNAYATKDGKELWNAPCAEGYNAATDIFVVDDIVWLGPFKKSVGSKNGLDLRTGEVKKTISTKGDPVGMAHDRCYRNKASLNYLFTCRDGIELHDYEKGWIRNNSWTRGPCQLGIIPANGLLYAPPDPCACHLKMRMPGFKAYSPERLDFIGKPLEMEGRLTRGPAFDKLQQLAKVKNDSEDWTYYRHDSQRSGTTPTSVTLSDAPKWTTKLGGKLTQPVSANGKVYVASSDTNTLYALESSTGKVLWSYIAGSTIDSSPTIYKGLLLFGSGDGKVHCLDAASGELAWTFLAAPVERLIPVREGLQSNWPVHGSVVVLDDDLYFTAGTSSYLGGGVYFYRLNPITGEVLASNVISNIDPVTEAQVGAPERGFDSDGLATDILTTDGESLFLKHLEIGKDGSHSVSTKKHLLSITSLLNDKWFVRSYWAYAPTITGAGWGSWARTANVNPAGRILSHTDDMVYGYGRIQVAGAAAGHKNNIYHLFAQPKVAPKQEKAPEETKGKKGKKKTGGRNKAYKWTKTDPFTVRAMVAAKNALILAGMPDLGERAGGKRKEFEDPAAAIEAFEGKRGSFLRIVSLDDGEKTKEVKLPGTPVFDGMSAAKGQLFISFKDGSVSCW